MLDKSDSSIQDDGEGAANIYAISSVDGNVIYHVSHGVEKDNKLWKRGPKKKTINPVKVKRIFAVTTLTNSDKGHQYVTERNQVMKELEVPPGIAGNRKISVFVNPLSMNGGEHMLPDETTNEDEVTVTNNKKNSAEMLKNAKRFKKSEFNKGSTGSLDESLFDTASTKTTSITITNNIINNNINNVSTF